LCEQLQLSPKGMCEMLKAKGCRIGGGTLGGGGMLWDDETGGLRLMPAPQVPPAGGGGTNRAGGIFPRAAGYPYSVAPGQSWERHFRFARAASAHSVRFLGIEASLPTRADVEDVERRYRPAA